LSIEALGINALPIEFSGKMSGFQQRRDQLYR